jgi:hypothetical protein
LAIRQRPRNDNDPSGYSSAGGEPILDFDSNGRLPKGAFNYEYQGGQAGQMLRSLGSYLENYQTDSPTLGALTGYYGSLGNSAAGMVTPSTYVNGLQSYGHNVNTTYNEGGVVRAGSYALSSWNMGAVIAAVANQNQVTGEPLGDWVGPRGTEFSTGVAGTAAVVGGGVGFYNRATVSSVPPVIPAPNSGLIGVTEGVASALARRVYGIEVEGQPAVSSVEAFGSRAGSTFRGRGPLPTSDLDIRITLSAVNAEMTEIGALFESAKGFPLEPTYVIPGLPPPTLVKTPFIPLQP